MKLTNTKIAKSKTLLPITDEVSIKVLPMHDMIALFTAVGSEDAKEQEEAINLIFDSLVVDAEGKKFDDLKNGKATEVLPMPVIMDLMSLISETLNPTGKM